MTRRNIAIEPPNIRHCVHCSRRCRSRHDIVYVRRAMTPYDIVDADVDARRRRRD